MKHPCHDPAGFIAPAVMIAVAALISCGGIVKVCHKNRQIEVERRIARVEDRIAMHKDEIRTMQMGAEQLLNRYVIKHRLDEHNSRLQPITHDSLDVIVPDQSVRAMALNQP